MKNKGYDVYDVSNYIVNYSIDQNKPVTPLKLQKLLYYVQAEFLVKVSRPAFAAEISSWAYGPVVESEYHRFKVYASREITTKIDVKNPDFRLILVDPKLGGPEFKSPEEVLSADDRRRIEKVVTSYFDYSAMAMVSKTHNETPWLEARKSPQEVIEQEEIKKYYSGHKNLIYGKYEGN